MSLWTEERVKKLKELWGKGNTASQIAEIIGGISRNAVIGKPEANARSYQPRPSIAAYLFATKT